MQKFASRSFTKILWTSRNRLISIGCLALFPIFLSQLFSTFCWAKEGIENRVADCPTLLSSLRQQDLKLQGKLTKIQQEELTRALHLVGIRRSKSERLYEKLRKKFGFQSRELVPIVQAGKASNSRGDKARVFVADYNDQVQRNPAEIHEAYTKLIHALYDLYLSRASEEQEEPWFSIDGKASSLEEFVNQEGYYQPIHAPSNQWMNVGRIPAPFVQNPLAKAEGYTRDMWWNRKTGINPIGSVRVARNLIVHGDGKEELISVEVLHKGKDGIFIPYLFERNKEGRLTLNRSEDGRRTTQSCFACHLRLSGIFFGGITQPGYKPAPYWYINAIDLTQLKYHQKFKDLVTSKP